MLSKCHFFRNPIYKIGEHTEPINKVTNFIDFIEWDTHTNIYYWIAKRDLTMTFVRILFIGAVGHTIFLLDSAKIILIVVGVQNSS